MNSFLSWLSQPWPWYVAGPLIGLTVPVLLLIGNKSFGISSSLRHICASCFPANIPFFQYNWRKEVWNLFFVAGILIGGFLAFYFLRNPEPVQVNQQLSADLAAAGITNYDHLVPTQIMNWQSLFSLRGFVFIVVGGFLVGFGTRYAGGCTSGHSIMGLSTLQWPSLVATCCFMVAGILMSNYIIPFLLKL